MVSKILLNLKRVKDKKIKTCLEHFGVEHAMQNGEFAQEASKNAYKLKTYIFPCGSITQCQGFEPYAFDILINIGYIKDDLVTKRNQVPEVWYNDPNNKKHRYYCDIFIPKENRIIEVRSTWTYEKDKDALIYKQPACEHLNFLKSGFSTTKKN